MVLRNTGSPGEPKTQKKNKKSESILVHKSGDTAKFAEKKTNLQRDGNMLDPSNKRLDVQFWYARFFESIF